MISYPFYICSDCGAIHGRRPVASTLALWVYDRCDMCDRGPNQLVTDPKEFGGLKPSWERAMILHQKEMEEDDQ